MSIDEVLTFVTVTWNTEKLIERAYTSIRKFHPLTKLIIVDGSSKNNSCYSYLDSIQDENTKVIHTEWNIGHGRGVVRGLEEVKTPFVLVFDSDIEMLKSPVQAMLDRMEDTTYGIGYIEKTDLGGFDFGARPDQMKFGSMKYLHPYFQLIQMKEYLKYEPFIHHGAPCVATMLDIHKRGIADVVLKEFVGLGHSKGRGFSWTSADREYIRHDVDQGFGGGTGSQRVKDGLPHIEGAWEYPDEQRILSKITSVVSKEKVSIITLTGDRPVCLSFLQKWLLQQTVQPEQWIVVDDGNISYRPEIACDYFRRERKYTDPKFTLVLNLKEALKLVKHDKILFMEDDEYYAPKYIETMVERLNTYNIVGLGNSKYYHIPSSTYYVHSNHNHASLAQTGIKGQFVNVLKSVLDGDSFLDIRLWGYLTQSKKLNWGNAKIDLSKGLEIGKDGYLFSDNDDSLYAGMKGMPGRGGIGSGHKDSIGMRDSFDKAVLKKWVPNNYTDYLKLLELWRK